MCTCDIFATVLRKEIVEGTMVHNGNNNAATTTTAPPATPTTTTSAAAIIAATTATTATAVATDGDAYNVVDYSDNRHNAGCNDCCCYNGDDSGDVCVS